MFCSTVIATVGRRSLSRAVESVLKQRFAGDGLEVIVVNDSGTQLPGASWQHSSSVQILNTNQHERSVARNTGAAVAKGRYLHFLDDDDWLADGAIQAFWELDQTGRAAWLYGGSQLVDREGKPLLQLHHRLQGNCFIQVMAGEWIPLQASLIEAETFFEVGGFNPQISGPEDIDLLRRIALRHEIAGTEATVANIVRGESGSTTDYDSHPQQSRWAREKILDAPGAFKRMRASAGNSYWRGRIVRAYLTSAIWNLQHRRLHTMGSRLVFALAGLVVAGSHVFSHDFVRAISRPYESETFLKGFQEAAAVAVTT